MAKDLPTTNQTSSIVDEFLASVAAEKPVNRGSLVFAIDATASREPTWDLAVNLQAGMFHEVVSLGPLDIKLIYFRGAGHVDRECKGSPWLSNPMQLAKFMAGIRCRAGITQISRVLEHTLREASQRKINALIYIGDCVEESRDQLMPQAHKLAQLGVPIFVFQEGRDLQAEQIFRELAQITRGAFHKFDQGSARQLGELLRAVALFATGGIAALERQGSAAARLLLGQIR